MLHPDAPNVALTYGLNGLDEPAGSRAVNLPWKKYNRAMGPVPVRVAKPPGPPFKRNGCQSSLACRVFLLTAGKNIPIGLERCPWTLRQGKKVVYLRQGRRLQMQ